MRVFGFTRLENIYGNDMQRQWQEKEKIEFSEGSVLRGSQSKPKVQCRSGEGRRRRIRGQCRSHESSRPPFQPRLQCLSHESRPHQSPVLRAGFPKLGTNKSDVIMMHMN